MNIQKVTHYTLKEGGPWITSPYAYVLEVGKDISDCYLKSPPFRTAKAIKTEDNSIYDCVLKRWRDNLTMNNVIKNKEDIESVLEKRENRYGDFTGHAKITQDLKFIMRQSPNWPLLTEDKKEALEMTAHKIGRILNGDPEYKDSWVDIEGYIHLVSVTLKD